MGLPSNPADVKEDSLQATWTETAEPVKVHSDSSDFYVEPQMCLILYTETDLHTASMHEPSCLKPRKHGRYVREWETLAAILRALFALSGFLIPQDKTQPYSFHLGLWPSHPSFTTPQFFLHSGRLFWIAGTVVQSLGVIITKQPLTLEKKLNFGSVRR